MIQNLPLFLEKMYEQRLTIVRVLGGGTELYGASEDSDGWKDVLSFAREH
jgi:hypothetical protein